MSTRYSAAGAIVTSLFMLSACAGGPQGVPSPDYVDIKKQDADGRVPFNVTDLINHIICEMAVDQNLPRLADSKYVAQLTLTLKVDDNLGLSPSLSFINPYSVAGTGMTFELNGNLNAARERTYSTTFTIDFETLNQHHADIPACEEHGIYSLSGNLGLAGIISTGLGQSAFGDTYIPPPPPAGHGAGFAVDSLSPAIKRQYGLNVKPEAALARAASSYAIGTNNPAANPLFGSTVQFAIARSADVGPNWILRHFRGPTQGKGLLNGGETDTDTLIVAFSPVTKSADTIAAEAALDAFNRLRRPNAASKALDAQRMNSYQLHLSIDKAQALGATQALTTSMILQNLGKLP